MVNPIGDGTGLENRASVREYALGVRLYPPSAIISIGQTQTL